MLKAIAVVDDKVVLYDHNFTKFECLFSVVSLDKKYHIDDVSIKANILYLIDTIKFRYKIYSDRDLKLILDILNNESLFDKFVRFIADKNYTKIWLIPVVESFAEYYINNNESDLSIKVKEMIQDDRIYIISRRFQRIKYCYKNDHRIYVYDNAFTRFYINEELDKKIEESNKAILESYGVNWIASKYKLSKLDKGKSIKLNMYKWKHVMDLYKELEDAVDEDAEKEIQRKINHKERLIEEELNKIRLDRLEKKHIAKLKEHANNVVENKSIKDIVAKIETPKFSKLNGNTTNNFDLIDVEISMISYCNNISRNELVSIIKHGIKELDEMVMEKIRNSKRFKASGIPEGFLNCFSKTLLTNDIFIYKFELKQLEESGSLE